MSIIQKIDFSPYTLYAKVPPNSKEKNLERCGALLRVLFNDLGFGYADCHPLETFGDLSVKEQLSCLKLGQLTQILKRSLHFAALDAKFRNKNCSIFEETNFLESCFPLNNFSSSSLLKIEDILKWYSNGFCKFKFKFGKNFEDEIKYLAENFNFFENHQIKIRIDFNGTLQNSKMLKFLIPYAKIIDYVEDPFDIIDQRHIPLLTECSNYFKFAVDFSSVDSSVEQYFKYKIIKPARESISDFKFRFPKEFVFTSSMDHPLGQICALFEACMIEKSMDHFGLITHHLFEPNDYSKELIVQNSRLMPVKGSGFGFDALLKKENWRYLCHCKIEIF